jgi:hypothetical protein
MVERFRHGKPVDCARSHGLSTGPQGAPALRAVYVADGQVEAYAALAESSGLGTEDCRALAELFLDRHQPLEALAWVERGMGLDRPRWERSVKKAEMPSSPRSSVGTS